MNRAVAVVLIAALVAGCGGGGSKDNGTITSSGPASAQRATVGMTDKLTFTPNVVNARVGTLVLTAKNQGAVPHNLVFADPDLGKSGTIGGNASEDVRAVFTRAGTFDFTCTFHSGMDGRVVVS